MFFVQLFLAILEVRLHEHAEAVLQRVQVAKLTDARHLMDQDAMQPRVHRLCPQDRADDFVRGPIERRVGHFDRLRLAHGEHRPNVTLDERGDERLLVLGKYR